MPVTNFDQLALTTGLSAANIAANVANMPRSHVMPTIATTGTQEVIFLAPCAGTLSAAAFIAKDALAASDTNYITFTVTNRSNASAAMLGTGNTTQVTGGTALTGYTRRALTLSGAPANLVVALNDVITFTTTVTGTLSGSVTEPLAVLTFTPS